MLRTRRIAIGKVTVARTTLPADRANTVATIYTVPAGNRAILRDIHLFPAGGAGTQAFIALLIRPSGGNQYYLSYENPAVLGKSIHMTGWDVVLEQGDTLDLSTWATTHYVVSGALLPLLP